MDEKRGRGRPNTGAGGERLTLRLPIEIIDKLKKRYGKYAPLATAVRLALREFFEGLKGGRDENNNL